MGLSYPIQSQYIRHRGNIEASIKMSGEGDDVKVEQADAPAPVETKMDKMQAVQQVLKDALCADGLARGLRESVRALDRKAAHFCVLCTDVDETAYSALVEALCTEHQIPYINVDNAKTLGQWAGLARLDQDGNVKKAIATKCVVVTDWGRESQAVQVLKDHFESQRK